MMLAYIRYSSFRRVVVLVLSLLHTCMPAMSAQAASGVTRNAPNAAGSLKVIVLDGNSAFNTVGNRVAVQPVVEIRDEDERPLSGATVVFQLPSIGPGASFPDGKLEQQVLTNTQGQATTKGMVPNAEKGQFHIKVLATLGDRTGTAVITQQNVDTIPAARRSSSRWWKYALIVGIAGGAAGAVALKSGGNSSSGTIERPGLTIVPGNISIGGPR